MNSSEQVNRIQRLIDQKNEEIIYLKNRNDELLLLVKQNNLLYFLYNIFLYLGFFRGIIRHVVFTIITIYVLIIISKYNFNILIKCFII
jgi:hypothetical protein